MKIDCNCIDGHSKIYLRNLILSDLERSRSDMQTALRLSEPQEVSTIMRSYEFIAKSISEILIEIEKVKICEK